MLKRENLCQSKSATFEVEHKGIWFEIKLTTDGYFTLMADGSVVSSRIGSVDEAISRANKYADSIWAEIEAFKTSTYETKVILQATWNTLTRLGIDGRLRGRNNAEAK